MRELTPQETAAVMEKRKAASPVPYANWQTVKETGLLYDVTLDGKPLKWCREANALEGWAVVCTPDERGQKHLVPGTKELATHRVFGTIVITPRQREDE